MQDRIKKMRKELKLSQGKLAELLNVSQANIAHYESGRQEMSITQAVFITKTYNLNLIWLLTGQGDMFINQSQSKPQAEPQQTHPSQCPTCQELKSKINQLEATIEQYEELEKEYIRKFGNLEGKLELLQELLKESQTPKQRSMIG